MADVIITLKIPSAKVAIGLEGWLTIYPNTETTDDEKPVAKYTDKQWFTEKLRRIAVDSIRRGLQMKANRAKEVALDDNLVTT